MSVCETSFDSFFLNLDIIEKREVYVYSWEEKRKIVSHWKRPLTEGSLGVRDRLNFLYSLSSTWKSPVA